MMYSPGRYMRGHKQAAVQRTMCACGCGKSVSRLGTTYRWGHSEYPCTDCGTMIRSANRAAIRCRACAKVAEKKRHDTPENKARMSQWNRDNAARMRAATHGLTVAEHDDMYRRQDGRCAICGTPGEQHGRTKQALVIDHWHGHGCESGTKHCSGCIRGLVCSPCNTAIGLMCDDTERLRRAAAYLETRGQLRLELIAA